MSIEVKRIYERALASDGRRILIDRLWPRGVSREKAALSEWMKVLAPSDQLRKWFDHDPDRWEEFKRRYFKELDLKDEVEELALTAKTDKITLVYASKDEKHNNAVALREYILGRARPSRD